MIEQSKQQSDAKKTNRQKRFFKKALNTGKNDDIIDEPSPGRQGLPLVTRSMIPAKSIASKGNSNNFVVSILSLKFTYIIVFSRGSIPQKLSPKQKRMMMKTLSCCLIVCVQHLRKSQCRQLTSQTTIFSMRALTLNINTTFIYKSSQLSPILKCKLWIRNPKTGDKDSSKSNSDQFFAA